MERINLAVASREATGKGPNRQLRASGLVPAVIYGTGRETVKVSLNNHDFVRILSAGGGTAMFNLLEHGATVATDENVAIIREIQRDPVTRQILHVDFYRIRMDVENDFEVPVHTIGIPAGVREGGILETLRHMIEICCLPTLLPKSIDIDVTGMKINQSFHARDLTLPEGVALVTDSEEVIFNILPPKEQVVVAPVEGEEVAQPEVITKKKEEGDGEAEKE